jgi:hypothetical protein
MRRELELCSVDSGTSIGSAELSLSTARELVACVSCKPTNQSGSIETNYWCSVKLNA